MRRPAACNQLRPAGPAIHGVGDSRAGSRRQTRAVRQELRTDVEQMAGAIRPFAVESEIKLKEFAGAAGPGFQFFDDRCGARPERVHVNDARQVKVGDVAVTSRSSTNEGQEAVVRSALAMLKSASRVR